MAKVARLRTQVRNRSRRPNLGTGSWRAIAKLTPEQRAKAAELYRDGWSIPQLAKRFEAHGQTIRELLIDAGEEVKTSRSRSLTNEQIEKATILRQSGQTVDAIACAVGGSSSSVRRALKNLKT